MTFEAFNRLPVFDQALVVATDSQFLCDYDKDGYAVTIFRLHDFFVKVSVEKADHKNTRYEAFEKETDIAW